MIRLGWKYGTVGLVVRTLRTRMFRVSDHERWKDLRNHEVDWDERTRAIAGLVPAGSHVIEFGAGRRQLERWLPAGCSYAPSDIVDRGPGTLLCDLNRRPLPTLGRKGPLQIAVFGGVMEYIVDLPSVLTWLSPQIDCVIASYNCALPVDRATKRLRMIGARLLSGWVNHYTEAEIIAFFAAAKFAVSKIVNGAHGEQIFVFSRGT